MGNHQDCVYCNHCLPCPAGIDIGAMMRLFDQARIAMRPELRAAYAALDANAQDCLACGECKERRPFGMPTVECMAEATGILAE
ncbi:MAG: 4Fe-4S dicluster domain-containing protein [Chloroflexi bacterium]|nr:4Fe-4S dicluster domain-containing protein [Chloroflexota bacterium]